MPSCAALATVPGREAALAATLASLRPQVDAIRVVCHDMTEPPDCVRDLADGWVCEPDRQGSAAKLRWARDWTGLYLGCDDDTIYPEDYAATMLRWVKRYKGKALVTCHGRVLKPKAKRFTDTLFARPPRGTTEGTWLNYPGGCAIAFDTRLQVPDVVPGKNLEEAYLAVWAQTHEVPIWLVPHSETWLGWLLEGQDLPTIWAEEKGNGFANRNAVLSTVENWQVHTCR